jgi:hypothetical protein
MSLSQMWGGWNEMEALVCEGGTSDGGSCQGLGDFDADHHKPGKQRSSPSDSFRSLSLSLSGAVRHASKGRLCIHVTVYNLESRL